MPMVSSILLPPKAPPNIRPIPYSPSPLGEGTGARFKVKMRILHVSNRPDIRAWKQAVVMLDRGHQVEFAGPTDGFGSNMYTRNFLFTDNKQLERTVQESRADVIHVHSDPNWLVPLVKQAAGSRPVIHDVHDPESMRTGQPPDRHELEAMRCVDGIIHVSEMCRTYSEKTHGADKPTIIVHSAVPLVLYGEGRNANMNAVCYQGGLTSLKVDHQGFAYYRNMTYVVEQFIKEKYQFSLFSAGSDELDHSYERLGAFLTRHLPYTTMLTGLRLHGFGFVGSPVVTPIIRAAMPNKLFEYISQGVVPICWNTDEAGEFVTKHGIGFHLHGDLVNLREQLKDGYRVREKLLKLRREFAMESQAEKLENFYQSLI